MKKRIDVIIPCFNCESTLEKAAMSALAQEECTHLWLIDDASSDATLDIANLIAKKYPSRVHVEKMLENKGPALVRNWGAMLAQEATYIAFLDADDNYQPQALEAANKIIEARPNLGVIRLPLTPHFIPEKYLKHPEFNIVWHTFEMTTATNLVFHRAYFLACGGFPNHPIFRKWGGEDGALGLATIQTSKVVVIENNENHFFGVDFHGRDDMHALPLFEAVLYGNLPEGLTDQEKLLANQFTQHIIEEVKALTLILNENLGKERLRLLTEED